MRLRVDDNRCKGHAVCSLVDAELFVLDDMGHSAVVDQEVPSGLEDVAHRGVQACPEAALTLEA